MITLQQAWLKTMMQCITSIRKREHTVVFLRGSDYTNRMERMKRLRDQVLENIRLGLRPIIASGMAEYAPETDSFVSEIFDRADKEMYENKQLLKKKENIIS